MSPWTSLSVNPVTDAFFAAALKQANMREVDGLSSELRPLVASLATLEPRVLPLHCDAQSSRPIRLLALDVDAWAGRATGSAAPVLAARGWRAVGLGPQDPLDVAWQELGSRVGAGAAR